jgi:hypothetical protein
MSVKSRHAVHYSVISKQASQDSHVIDARTTDRIISKWARKNDAEFTRTTLPAERQTFVVFLILNEATDILV